MRRESRRRQGLHRPSAVLAHALLVATMIGLSPRADACALEPSFQGGSLVSHPGALGVAVAFADARRQGALKTDISQNVPNDVRLRRMVADLQRLRSTLTKGRAASSDRSSARFSLMLIGPSLWSEFLVSPSGILARYHIAGPVTGQAVVLTHHTVLLAMLKGDLSLGQARNLGLIAFSGADSETVAQFFEHGFGSTI